jgi:hypothetical protein
MESAYSTWTKRPLDTEDGAVYSDTNPHPFVISYRPESRQRVLQCENGPKRHPLKIPAQRPLIIGKA